MFIKLLLHISIPMVNLQQLCPIPLVIRYNIRAQVYWLTGTGDPIISCICACQSKTEIAPDILHTQFAFMKKQRYSKQDMNSVYIGEKTSSTLSVVFVC